MEITKLFPMILNLQLFAEGTGTASAGGADGGTGSEGAMGVTETVTTSLSEREDCFSECCGTASSRVRIPTPLQCRSLTSL